GEIQVAARGRGTSHAELRRRGDGGVDGQAGRQTLRGRAYRIERAEGIAHSALRAGLAGDQRQAAVVVQEEQAEFRAVVEVRRVVLEVEAVLAAVGRLAGLEPVHGLEVGDVRAAQGPEIHALVGERTEAQHHLGTAG